MRKAPASGLHAWLLQRLTAVYLLFFFVFLLAYFAFYPPASYEAWRDRVSSTAFCIAASVFVIALLVHVWVGLRDVMLDYVKPLSFRIGMLTLLAFSLVGMAAWATLVLFAASA